MNAPALGSASLDALRARVERVAARPAVAAVWTRVRRIMPGGAGPLVLYGLYALVVFVIALAATFPHELVLRSALEPAASAPIAVEIRGVHLGWMLGYTIDELRLLRRDADPSLPVLTATRVDAAPSLLGLLRGQPFPVGVRADLYGGTLDGNVDLRSDAFAAHAALAHVDVARYSSLRLFMEGTLAGRIDGTLELAGSAGKPASTTGRIDLRATDLALEGGKIQGITVPDLHFPELRLEGVVKGGRLDLGDVSARGREVTVQGSGNVLLAHPLAASLLNLELVLTPAGDIPDTLRLALNLIPGEPGNHGERKLHLSGTLAQPRATK